MAFSKFALTLAVAFAALPLAAEAASLHDPVSSNGDHRVRAEALDAASSTKKMIPAFRGDTQSLSYRVIEDALATLKGGEMSYEEFEVLNALEAMGAPVGTESIIGRDTRRRVRRTKRWPNRAVTLVTFSAGRCTGWLMSPDTVATAGHCVHEGDGGDFYPVESYKIYPGANGSRTPYGSCNATNLHTVRGWAKRGRDDFDYGAIKLDCDIGETVGYLGFFWKRGSLNGMRTIITGFPGDKRLTMWRSKGRVTATERRRVFYRNDTTGGMSGSPVYRRKRGCNSFCAMAIHAYGTYNGPPYSTNNHGTRINRAVYRNLRKWRR
ncbi:trypsin-like serine peptidase [Microbaculum sp. FT89]|uniref:trypsin-like serine peptidase n=1 Tax=Microbaculum sp. FT89 TaxID=3447298 RepID=UPI003F5385EB